MHVKVLGVTGTWRDVADAARTTVGLGPGDGEPPASWKRKLLLAEHSPIRLMSVRWIWYELPYWVSVQFVRHKFGIEHFVQSQRSDRTGVPRSELPQSALVNHECIANFQAIINISRKRLCSKASPETRAAWESLMVALRPLEPELRSVCVPGCVYRGFCPEPRSCGYAETTAFITALNNYR